MKRWIVTLFTSAAMLMTASLFALTFPLPKPGNDVVGQFKIIQSKKGDTLFKLARRYEMGYDELKEANKKLPSWGRIKPNTAVVIPEQFVLPDAPREGIVVNLPEKRLYLYSNKEPVVITEPIAIGIYGWPTPLLDGTIIEKAKDPTWHIPESIQIERELEGKPPITFIGPGPDNPLGQYALRTSNRSILLHGTNAVQTIGRRASHGCMRMYPEDVEELFYSADLKMPIRIINQPFKAGWENQRIYLEVHPTLVEHRGSVHERVTEAFNILMNLTNQNKKYINWASVETTLIQQEGIPRIVSR